LTKPFGKYGGDTGGTCKFDFITSTGYLGVWVILLVIMDVRLAE